MSKSKKIITVILTILMLTVFFIIYVLIATIAPRSGKSGLIFSMLLYVICGIILEMTWIIKAILAGRKKKNPLKDIIISLMLGIVTIVITILLSKDCIIDLKEGPKTEQITYIYYDLSVESGSSKRPNLFNDYILQVNGLKLRVGSSEYQKVKKVMNDNRSVTISYYKHTNIFCNIYE